MPLINIVFLLLIFFMITATLEAAPPFDVDAPVAEGAQGDAVDRIHISASGEVAYGSAQGADALAQAATVERLTVVADGRLPADRFSRILTELKRLGATDLELEVRAP